MESSAWIVTLGSIYSGCVLSGCDALYLSELVDKQFNTEIHNDIANYGDWVNIGFALTLNEMLEPIRLPLVIYMTPKVVDYMQKNGYFNRENKYTSMMAKYGTGKLLFRECSRK